MREGVLAFLVAPDAAPALREMLISYSSHFHIPLATSLSPRSFTRSEYAISTQVSVAEATASLLRRYRWSQVAYVYDDSASPDILGEWIPFIKLSFISMRKSCASFTLSGWDEKEAKVLRELLRRKFVQVFCLHRLRTPTTISWTCWPADRRVLAMRPDEQDAS